MYELYIVPHHASYTEHGGMRYTVVPHHASYTEHGGMSYTVVPHHASYTEHGGMSFRTISSNVRVRVHTPLKSWSNTISIFHIEE